MGAQDVEALVFGFYFYGVCNLTSRTSGGMDVWNSGHTCLLAERTFRTLHAIPVCCS
jgi:hypothetical protein